MAKISITPRYHISPKVFQEVLWKWRAVVKVVDLEDYINNAHEWKKNVHTIFYDEKTHAMILNRLILEGYGILNLSDHYMQKVVAISSESVKDDTDAYQAPYLNTCIKYVNKILYGAGYNDDEIFKCLMSCRVETHQTPVHSLLPIQYRVNTIHAIHNCVYYDINNAHMDALCEIFPKAATKFQNLRERINKLKKSGDRQDQMMAQWLKDVINFYVGGLGKKLDENTYCEHRGTYEWIVARTRAKLENTIAECQGEVIYANTDGVIIHAPKHIIETSDKLGEFKSELANDTIYAYVHMDLTKETSPYYLYQYVNAKGKMEIKGNMPHMLRNKVDLSQGRTVVYKTYEDNKIRNFKNITEINEEIKQWEQ